MDGSWTQNPKLLDQISQYDLTGAQIDNVLKKMNLLSCDDNYSVQNQLLFDLIEEEELTNGGMGGVKIGF